MKKFLMFGVKVAIVNAIATRVSFLDALVFNVPAGTTGRTYFL